MMDYEPRRPTKAVEDYTNAFLCMACLLIFMLLVALWAVFGYLVPLVAALFIGKSMRWLPRRD